MNLARTLALFSHAQRHNGELTLDEATAILGVSKDQLANFVANLVVSGAPPFLPEDLMEVDIDGDWLILDPHPTMMGRAAFSPAEAAVAIASLRSLRQGSQGALANACRAAEETIRRATDPEERAGTLAWAHDQPVDPTLLDTLTLAVRDRKVIVLDYFSASQNQRKEREVLPHAVISHQGRWYLGGFLDNGEHRLFRVDRVAGIDVLERSFEPQELPIYQRDVLFDAPPQMVEAEVWFAGARPEPMAAEATGEPGVYRVREVTWPVLARRLMALEDDWEVRRPAEFRGMVAEWATQMAR